MGGGSVSGDEQPFAGEDQVRAARPEPAAVGPENALQHGLRRPPAVAVGVEAGHRPQALALPHDVNGSASSGRARSSDSVGNRRRHPPRGRGGPGQQVAGPGWSGPAGCGVGEVRGGDGPAGGDRNRRERGGLGFFRSQLGG